MMCTTFLLGAMTAMCGFEVKSVEELPDISAKLWRMEYTKNGADLVWLECADENRTFAITFRTIPEDHTGVAHILEHAVLCGSEKFPSREPFVELLKSSPHTYLNAFTAKDSTGYPVASRNEKDFLNLTEVYLDAVFHPNTVKSDWSMRQEGWHYEYDGETLTRNGIVYSEMKGAMSAPHTVMYHQLLEQLFPNTVYHFNSGGKPSDIPHLTYAQYTAFHAKHYHPSNARIFLYGKIDLEKTLGLIGAALEPYARRTETIEIPWQNPVASDCSIEYASSEVTNKTLLCEGWVVGRYDDYEKLMALEVLSEYLTGSNFSPLKAPLIKSGLCEDVGMGVIREQQAAVMINLENVKDGSVEAIRRLMDETLEKICADGLDTKRLGQLLDKHEFQWRERDTSDRGMNLYREMMESWLYGGDPAQNLRATAVFASLRARIGTGWYETLLRAAVGRANSHHARLEMVPSATLADRETEADRAALRKIREAMSDAELEAIAAAAADLKRRHAEPESPEILAKLPKLTLSDMPVDCEIIGRTIETNGTLTVIRPDQKLAGFFYLDLCFDLKDLTPAELVETPMLADILGELKSAKYSPEELRGEMDGTFGSIMMEVASYETGPQFVVRLAALDSHREAALALVEEILLRTDYSDAEAIATLRAQIRNWREQAVRGRAALEYVGRRAASSLSTVEATADLLKGLGQLRHLQTGTPGDFAALAKKIFTREKLTIALAGETPENFPQEVAAHFPQCSADASRAGVPRAEDGVRVSGPRNEGFTIDGGVAFAALAAKLPKDVAYSGVQQVAAKIVSLEHLWPELRVKGGAYGAFFSVGANRTLSFSTYRDPNPARAYEQYAKAGEKLAAFVKAGTSFEKYQVSTLELTDPNFSPRQKMAYVRAQYFNGRDPELPRRLRREIIGTTKADLLAFAETLTAVVPTAARCVIGKDTLVDACSPTTVESIVVGK